MVNLGKLYATAQGGIPSHSFVSNRAIHVVVIPQDRLAEIPATTPVAAAVSRDLRRRGFNFVGPTICYAFMQAAGMVNDHLVHCFRYREVGI